MRLAVARIRPTTIADVMGCLLVFAGVALIYLPAALIVLGALVLVASWAAAGKDST